MIDKIIEVERIEDVINVFGSFDQNLRILESELGVKVLDREDVLHICGEGEDVLLAEKAISGLLTLAAKGEQINDQNVRYVLKLVRQGREDKIQELVGDVICITAGGKPVKPKTLGQKLYCDAIANNTVTLGIGPAGTGKSFLAVAAAVAAFRAEEVNRIILTRPAVEAGERLGFLPGDLQRWTPTCAPCMTPCLKCSASTLIRSTSREGTLKWRLWRICAAARWMTASSSSMKRRIPQESR